MGHRRTLLRKQDHKFVTKRNRAGDHKITTARATPNRRITSEVESSAQYLVNVVGVPESFFNWRFASRMYKAYYHFTKGWRVRA